MRTALPFIIVILASLSVSAQTGTIRGRVRTTEGDALSGVTVRVRDTPRGAVARDDGTFVIASVPTGRQYLDATLVGYAKASRDVTVRANDTVSIDLVMRVDAVSTQDVVVVGSRRQAQTDTRTSVQTVTAKEAKFRAGAGEDVFRSLQGLPGVTAPSDFSSQLVIRGSGPDQNLILMDGIELFNPYRLYGFISMFNPETVNTITLMTGGFPAPYSDRLSAVLDVTNRDGDRDKGAVGGKLSMSVTNANLVVEGRIPVLDGSYVAGARTMTSLPVRSLARRALWMVTWPCQISATCRHASPCVHGTDIGSFSTASPRATTPNFKVAPTADRPTRSRWWIARSMRWRD
jgi:hypothetical protein